MKGYSVMRKDWDEFCRDTHNAIIICTCGDLLQNKREARDHWQMGHMDYIVKKAEEAKSA